MMGLREADDIEYEDNDEEDEIEDEEEARDVMPAAAAPRGGGIISSLWGLQHSYLSSMLKESGEFDMMGNRKISAWD